MALTGSNRLVADTTANATVGWLQPVPSLCDYTCRMPDRHGNYSWYDTPDGQDSHKKAFYISKWAAKLGNL